MTQARTIACEGTKYVSWLFAGVLFFIAFGQAAKLYGMVAQARRQG